MAATYSERGVRTSGALFGSRVRSDGVVLTWQTLWIEEPAHPLVPFFIRWGAGTPHPSTTAPAGARLASFRLETPDPEPLCALLARLDLEVEVVAGPTPRIAIEIAGPRGVLRL